MAFTGAPAAFPVIKRNAELHRYLQWSDYIDGLANKFVEETIFEQPFIGMHMRNGADWVGIENWLLIDHNAIVHLFYCFLQSCHELEA